MVRVDRCDALLFAVMENAALNGRSRCVACAAVVVVVVIVLLMSMLWLCLLPFLMLAKAHYD